MKQINEYYLAIGKRYHIKLHNIKYSSNKHQMDVINRKFKGIVPAHQEMEKYLITEFLHDAINKVIGGLKKPAHVDRYIFSEERSGVSTIIIPNHSGMLAKINESQWSLNDMEFGIIGDLESIKLAKLYAMMHGWNFIDNGVFSSVYESAKANDRHTGIMYNLLFEIITYRNKETKKSSSLYNFYFTGSFYEMETKYYMHSDKDEAYDTIKTYGPKI